MSIDILGEFQSKPIDCISIGKISEDVFNSIKEHAPDFACKIKNRTVFFWKNRIEHISKHKNDANNLGLDEILSVIPTVISSPDYIGVVNKNDKESLQFVKRLDNGFLVAIRLNDKGNLSFRTAYSITDSQITDYLRKKSLWEFAIDK